MAGCQPPDRTPPGFRVLGTKTPDRYHDDPAAAGFAEKQPDDLQAKDLAYTIPEKRRGYVVFAKDYLDPVYPGTQPRRSEVTDEVSLFSAQAEYEPVTFSVNAWRNLENLRAAAGPLTHSGAVIPVVCIDLRSVRCVPRRVGQERSYIVKPTLLEKRDSVNVKRGQSQRFWMTVWTPPGQEPGIYTGAVTITAAGVKSFTLTVKHEVLDLQLAPSSIPQGMYYWAVDPGDESFAALPDERLYQDMINMSAHGMNTLMLLVPPEAKLQADASGRWHCDVSDLRGVRDAVLAAGFDSVIHHTPLNRIYGNSAEKDGDKRVGAYVAALEKDGWPEVIYSSGDQSHTDSVRAVEVNERLAHFKRMRPNLRTLTPIDCPEHSEAFEPHADIRLFSGYVGPVAREKTRQAGREFWIYSGPSGSGADPREDRFRRGIWAKTLDVNGALDWAYISWRTAEQPFNDLIAEMNQHNSTCWVFPGNDGPLPTPSWEGLREGIEDWRYITRLEQLIDRAKGVIGKPEVAVLALAARKSLDQVLLDVDNRPITHKKETAVNREQDEPPFDDPLFYSRFRRLMVGYILLLEEKMG